MEEKRTCSGACEKFRVKRPPGGSRYSAGQARCQICEIWMDRRGAHMKDGSPAVEANAAWYCNCCRYRLRRTPRKSEYKPAGGRPPPGEREPDMSRFNKRRALMLGRLGRALAQKADGDERPLDRLLPSRMRVPDIEAEFGTGIGEILAMAGSERPNAVSLVAEFESVMHRLKRVPTGADMESSRFSVADYEAQFGSWERMLDRLGHDPWYRKEGPAPRARARVEPWRGARAAAKSPDGMRESIMEMLRGEPLITGLFETVDSQISTMDRKAVERAARTTYKRL